MSLVKVCDCDCHDGSCWECGGGAREVPDDVVTTFGTLDVCDYCLDVCWYWKPTGAPNLNPPPPGAMERLMGTYLDDLLARALRTEPLFKGVSPGGTTVTFKREDNLAYPWPPVPEPTSEEPGPRT